MTSLLVILPVSLLFLAALGILILQQVRPSIGYAWLIGAVLGFAAVAASLFLRWRVPLEFSIDSWRPFADLSSPPAFRLDLRSWPYIFSLALLALAFILTDAARLDTEARPFNWAAGLAIAAMGMLSVMSANPITLAATWTALDLLEFLMVLSTPAGRRMGVQTVTVFSVRVMGTLLVILAILFARSQSIDFVMAPIPAEMGLFMLLAAGLRLGVLPLNLPYTREVYTWRGLGNVMRMVVPASALMVLGRMPEAFLPLPWKGFFLALSALAALYGGAMWLASDNEINGRPFWFISLAALAVTCVINGFPQASIAWGMVLILCGSVLFFFSARRRQVLFIPLLAILGIMGLPFNPAAAGWQGVATTPFNTYQPLYLLAVLCLVWGYLRHTLRAREELYRMERWVHTVYPMGMLFLILGQWVVGIIGWPGSLTVGAWWASIALAFLAGLGMVAAYSFRKRFTNETVTGRWVGVFIDRTGGALSAFFRLNWLYRFITWIYQVLQSMIQLLTAIFEGDGGILWSMVMLALLISLIWMGGK